MTDKTMQISFLPQDIELIKSFVYGKGYLNRVTYNSKLDGLYINMSKVKDNYELCSDITDLIISLIKKRDLKDYIWKTYTNINDNESHLNSLIKFIKPLKNVQKVELLPYHTLGVSKYDKLNLFYPLKDTPSMDPKKCHKMEEYINSKLNK